MTMATMSRTSIQIVSKPLAFKPTTLGIGISQGSSAVTNTTDSFDPISQKGENTPLRDYILFPLDARTKRVR